MAKFSYYDHLKAKTRGRGKATPVEAEVNNPNPDERSCTEDNIYDGGEERIDIVKEAEDEALIRDLNERKAYDNRMNHVEELLKKFKKGN